MCVSTKNLAGCIEAAINQTVELAYLVAPGVLWDGTFTAAVSPHYTWQEGAHRTDEEKMNTTCAVKLHLRGKVSHSDRAKAGTVCRSRLTAVILVGVKYFHPLEQFDLTSLTAHHLNRNIILLYSKQGVTPSLVSVTDAKVVQQVGFKSS